MTIGIRILSRLLALFVLLGIATLLWFSIVQPLAVWKARTLSGLEASRSEYTRLQASLIRLKSEKSMLESATTLSAIWQAKKAGEATALVQSEISNLAATSGVTLRSITPTASRDLPFSSAIGFRIEGEATLNKAVDFFVAIEASTPALITERVILRRLARPGRTAAQPIVFIQLSLIAPVILDSEDEI